MKTSRTPRWPPSRGRCMAATSCRVPVPGRGKRYCSGFLLWWMLKAALRHSTRMVMAEEPVSLRLSRAHSGDGVQKRAFLTPERDRSVTSSFEPETRLIVARLGSVKVRSEPTAVSNSGSFFCEEAASMVLGRPPRGGSGGRLSRLCAAMCEQACAQGKSASQALLHRRLRAFDHSPVVASPRQTMSL